MLCDSDGGSMLTADAQAQADGSVNLTLSRAIPGLKVCLHGCGRNDGETLELFDKNAAVTGEIRFTL